MQGPRALKRIVAAVVAVAALGLVFAAGSALAALSITKQNATKGDKVEFKIDGLQDGDIWELRVADGDAQTDSYLKDGFAEGVTEVQGEFEMPDLGSTDKPVDIKAYIIRGGETIVPAGDFIHRMTYVAPPPTGTTGTTGDSGSTGSGAASEHVAAAAPAAAAVSSGSTGTTDSSKKSKKKASEKTTARTKKQSSGGGNNKKNDSSGGAGQPDSSPAPVEAPVAEPVTPVTPASDSLPTLDSSTSSSSTPAPPDTPPPGPGGPPPTGSTPQAPPPTPPAGLAPVVPASTSSPDSGFSVPIVLVLLLGLLTLGGLGGAQARMLGLWGPQPRMSKTEARDARLLALSRVAQSGASLQRKIAEHKQSAKERQPLN